MSKILKQKKLKIKTCLRSWRDKLDKARKFTASLPVMRPSPSKTRKTHNRKQFKNVVFGFFEVKI